MADLITRILPIMIIIALVLFFVIRLIVWTTRKGRDGNPPRDSGDLINTKDHSHHDISSPPPHH